MIDNVLTEFSALAGLTPSQWEEWEFLCKEATDTLSVYVSDEKRQSREFFSACGALCFYKYILILAARGELDTVTTGDMSIKSNANDKISYAKELYFQRIRGLNIALPNNGFYFGSV